MGTHAEPRRISLPIGTLDVLDTFVYYDCPRLFSCRSMTGQKYLALWVEAEDEADRWFFVPISDARLDAVMTGEMPLRFAISTPEEGWLWQIRTYYDGREGDAQRIPATDISDQDLPDAEVFLHYVQAREEPRNDVSDVVRTAVQRAREIVRIKLDAVQNARATVDTLSLGYVLVHFQKLVSRLGYDGGSRGRIPQSIADELSLRTLAFSPGSFQVYMESGCRQPSLDDSRLVSTLRRLTELLEASSNKERLTEVLTKTNAPSVTAYRSLLTALNVARSGIDVAWASSFERNGRAVLGPTQVTAALEMLGEEGKEWNEQLEVTGELVGINVERNRFDLRGDDGNRYSGVLSDELGEVVFEVPTRVRATIEATVMVNPATSEETVQYTLVQFERAMPS